MDSTTVDSVYENLLSAQNFFALHEQQQSDKQNLIDMANTAVVDLDMYRFEDGGGDARGSLHLDENFCTNFNGAAATTDDDDAAGQQSTASTSASSSTMSATVSTSTTSATVAAAAAAATVAVNAGTITKTSPQEPQENDQDENRPIEGYELLTMINARQTNDFLWATQYRLSRPAPTINIGDENFMLRLDTVFVLGMRQNVTKNDIIMFFGKMGNIKVDELTSKPKIFVYKNKLTGRSKGEATITYTNPYAAQAAINYLDGSVFLGQTLSVVPAYLSTRPGRSVRFTYAQELGDEQQRRQRQKRWKPAIDNWVCELCRNSNFVWRLSCNRCRVSKSEAVTLSNNTGPNTWRPRKHDWTCGYCYNVNFWYRQKCNRCHAPKAELHAGSDSDREKWELVVSQTSVASSQL